MCHSEDDLEPKRFGRADDPETIVLLDKIRVRSGIQKYAHFIGAERGRRSGEWLSIPVVVINIVTSSALFVLVKSEVVPEEAKWIGAVLTLVAAILGGLQTHFNLKKGPELHHSVANRFLELSRTCELLLAAYRDKAATVERVIEQLTPIHASYLKVCKDAESVPTSKAQYCLARKRFSAEEKFC